MTASLPAEEEALAIQTIEMFEVVTQSNPLDSESLEILKVDPLTAFGTPVEIVGLFGGKPAYLAAIRELETALYQHAA